MPTLHVVHPEKEELAQAVQECLEQTHIRAALAVMISTAIATGAAAAAPAAKAFVDLLLACVVQKLGGKVNIWVDWPSEWGDWEKL